MTHILRLFGFLLAISPSLTIACSCGYVSYLDAITQTADITHVRINELEGKNGRLRAYFEIIESFKGDPTKVDFITAAINPMGSACQVTVEQGEELVLFSNERGPMGLSLCSLTKRVTNRPHYLEILQKLVDEDEAASQFAGTLVNQFGGLYLKKEDELFRIVEWPDFEKASEKTAQALKLLRSDKVAFEAQFYGYRLSDGSIFFLSFTESE